jgi:hypothetical protein
LCGFYFLKKLFSIAFFVRGIGTEMKNRRIDVKCSADRVERTKRRIVAS